MFSRSWHFYRSRAWIKEVVSEKFTRRGIKRFAGQSTLPRKRKKRKKKKKKKRKSTVGFEAFLPIFRMDISRRRRTSFNRYGFETVLDF